MQRYRHTQRVAQEAQEEEQGQERGRLTLSFNAALERKREGEDDGSVRDGVSLFAEALGGGNEWSCPTFTSDAALLRHEADECPLRAVECPLACGQLVPVGNLNLHRERRCPHRLEQCR